MPRPRLFRIFAVLVVATLASSAVISRPLQGPPAGMSSYVVLFLKRSPTATAPPDAATIAGHLAHLRELAIAGDAVAAGPMTDPGDIAGIIIVREMTPDKAAALETDDPLVKSGIAVVEAHPWWGPKGIGDGYAARAKDTPLEKLPFSQYQFGLLKRGPAWTPEQTPELKKLQESHLAHISEMAATGKLVAAGPFTDDGTLRGLFIFQTTPDDAKAMASEDPMVKVNRLVFELHSWMTTEGVIPSTHK